MPSSVGHTYIVDSHVKGGRCGQHGWIVVIVPVALSLLDRGGLDPPDIFARFQRWAAADPKDIGFVDAGDPCPIDLGAPGGPIGFTCPCPATETACCASPIWSISPTA